MERDDPYDGDEGDEDGDDEITPDDPDYDLSEAHGYRWEPERAHWPVPPWLLVALSLLVIVALVLPGLLFVLRST